MIYEVTINNKKYEVEVEKGNAAIVSIDTVATPNNTVPVPQASPKPDAESAAKPAAVSAEAVKGEAIKAPMPGTILDIKAAAGSRVKKGDVIFILEAMKMENEITAPWDGIIVQIRTAKGTAVNTGDILAAIQQ